MWNIHSPGGKALKGSFDRKVAPKPKPKPKLFNISLPCFTQFRPAFFSRLATRGGGGLRRPPFIIKKPLGHLNCTVHFQHVGKLDWHNDVIWRHYDVKLINLLTESVNVSPRNGKNNGKVSDKIRKFNISDISWWHHYFTIKKESGI